MLSTVVAVDEKVVEGLQVQIHKGVDLQLLRDRVEGGQQQAVTGAVPVGAHGEIVIVAEAGLEKARLLLEEVIAPTLPPTSLPLRSSCGDADGSPVILPVKPARDLYPEVFIQQVEPGRVQPESR